jgi:hypothetical protein
MMLNSMVQTFYTFASSNISSPFQNARFVIDTKELVVSNARPHSTTLRPLVVACFEWRGSEVA